MKRLARLTLALPLMAMVALASSTFALADNGVSLAIAPTAELNAKVQVVTTITVSCPSGWLTMGGSVSVEQAVGKSIASGTGYFSPGACTGDSKTIEVTILADPGGPPFKKGTAIVAASFAACDYTVGTCGSATTSEAIRLR